MVSRWIFYFLLPQVHMNHEKDISLFEAHMRILFVALVSISYENVVHMSLRRNYVAFLPTIETFQFPSPFPFRVFTLFPRLTWFSTSTSLGLFCSLADPDLADFAFWKGSGSVNSEFPYGSGYGFESRSGSRSRN